MPNGGDPGGIVIKPNDGSPYVIFLGFDKFLIYSKSDWEIVTRDIYKNILNEEGPKPLISFNESEAGAIISHLEHWFGGVPYLDDMSLPRDLNIEFRY